MINVSVQEMIRVILQDKNYSQYKLAKDIGTSQATINRAVKGEVDVGYKKGKAIENLYNEVVREKA